MMNRLPRIGLVLSCLLLVFAGGLVVSSSAPLGRVDVRVDGLAFEPGSAVALEFVRAEGATCFGDVVFVEEVQLTDATGNLLSVVPYGSVVASTDWLGVVMLRAGDGSNLPSGSYEIRVVTSEGTFTAGLNVVPSVQFSALSRFVAGVPGCNIALRAYRLITELDDGTRATMRVGDRLMVLLAGNPTTGYSWSNGLTYEYASVRESDEMEYRSISNLLGASGYFIFRFWAVDAGAQEFRFEYERPWESVDPIQTLTFSVDVRK